MANDHGADRRGQSLTTQAGVNLPNVSQLWNAQPDLLCPCVRGPRLTAPGAVAAVNVPGRLDMDSSVIEGNAVLDKPLPLLRGAIPGSGRFRFNLFQDIFDSHWEFYTLNIPTNDYIRALVWWDIEHSDLAALDQVIAQNKLLLDQDLQLLQTSPQRPDLYPLDADDEFNRYYGYVDYQSYLQNNGTLDYEDYIRMFPNHSPDFYPRLARLCNSDPNTVYFSGVSRVDQNGKPNPKSLLSRIDRLPCTMSQGFTTMYKKWICELEKCGFPDGQIEPLRQRYQDLAQFAGTQGCSIGNLPAPCTCPPMTTCTCPPSPVGVGR
jgi:hypothetical protein